MGQKLEDTEVGIRAGMTKDYAVRAAVDVDLLEASFVSLLKNLVDIDPNGTVDHLKIWRMRNDAQRASVALDRLLGEILQMNDEIEAELQVVIPSTGGAR